MEGIETETAWKLIWYQGRGDKRKRFSQLFTDREKALRASDIFEASGHTIVSLEAFTLTPKEE